MPDILSDVQNYMSDTYIEELYRLAKAVCNKYFAFVQATEKDDLIQEGVMKAISLLSQGHFDPKRAPIRNYLFTGMRNSMTNFRAKTKKEIPVEDFTPDILPIEKQVEAEWEQVEEKLETPEEELGIPLSCIDSVLRDFPRYLGYRGSVISRIVELGFSVPGSTPVLIDDYSPIIDRLVVLIVWQKRVYSRFSA